MNEPVSVKVKPGVVTLSIIGICILLFLSPILTGSYLFYDSLLFASVKTGDLSDIMAGEIWRLISPIFLHSQANFLHILFNMIWLYDLGSAIEMNESPKRLIILVILIGVASNISQYVVSGPLFLGMSGVIYGLLGYIWYLSRYAPQSRYLLNTAIMKFMLVWLVICFTGLVGNIANTAHVSGLIVGVLLGFIRGAQLTNQST
jgi:GlpG protein